MDREPMSGELFAQELLSALEDAFPPALGKGAPAAPAAGQGSPESATQIVVSPLFKDFTVDEMVAVIQGLELLSFEPGDVILHEGEPGHSLYMLASGKVKIFRRNASGRSALVGELAEGAFFGEGSVLTGRPRNATVVAASRCELLELDRARLEAITKTHPRVWDILRDFAQKRQ
jgi:CRP-like cAMP-binding protein